jgi:flagellar assembly factor FliW
MSPSTEELALHEPAPPEELRFVAPLLGLEHLSRFVLVQLDPDSPLFSLQSVEDAGVRLLVLATEVAFEDYSPAFDAVARAAVGLGADDAGLVLAVVTPGPSLAESTANLLAPVLLNPVTGAAAQVVLTGSEYPLRLPLAS